jgi:hypothetical protein
MSTLSSFFENYRSRPTFLEVYFHGKKICIDKLWQKMGWAIFWAILKLVSESKKHFQEMKS